MSRVRNYCFTVNNYDEDDIIELLSHIGENKKTDTIKYLTMQEEIAPTTGTPHLQGYLELHKAYTIRSLKRKINCPRLSLRERHGSQTEAIVYCQKIESRKPNGRNWDEGVKKRQSSAVQMIMQGKSMTEVAQEFPAQFVRSHRGLQALQYQLQTPRNWAMEVIIYYGQTGTGKTYTATKAYPDAYQCKWPTKGGIWWWPGYDGQETVIMDEFRHQISFGVMLKLLDRTSFPVQFKGGFKRFTSKRLVFTTQLSQAAA